MTSGPPRTERCGTPAAAADRVRLEGAVGGAPHQRDRAAEPLQPGRHVEQFLRLGGAKEPHGIVPDRLVPRLGAIHACVCSVSSWWARSPRPNGECRMTFSRIGWRFTNIRILPLSRRNTTLNGNGGNVSNASQFVRTTRPMRLASVSIRNWHSAPPVSLPTSVTSRRSSARGTRGSAWPRHAVTGRRQVSPAHGGSRAASPVRRSGFRAPRAGRRPQTRGTRRPGIRERRRPEGPQSRQARHPVVHDGMGKINRRHGVFS